MQPKHTEPVTEDGQEVLLGRDPRKMSAAELTELGHRKRPLLDVIRQNCIDCQGGSPAEVRRCRSFACPMWPYRMKSNPFHTNRASPEQRAAAVGRLQAARAAKAILL